MKKKSLKLTALFLALSCFPAFAEQTVDIEVQGIRGFRAVRNTDLNVNLINKEEMDGSERYQHLVTKAVDRGLRVFGYYESSVRFEQKQRQGKRDLLIAHVTPGEPTKIAGTDVQIEGKPHKMKILMHCVKTYRKMAFWLSTKLTMITKQRFHV